jgi:2',3'-cyclic-nucleotide 2'-phosphodiesterase (5'-nucleotidase family)
MIDDLPKGTIDGIIQGHRHKIANYYYNGIPYMGATNGGFYLHSMSLKFDSDNKLTDSYIEGPIPICEKVF